MKHFLSPLIFFSIPSLVWTLDYQDQDPCCGNHTTRVHYRSDSFRCDNGQKLNLKCEQENAAITDGDFYDDTSFLRDEDGKYMILSYEHGYGFLMRSSYYCVINEGSIRGKPYWSMVYCPDEMTLISPERRMFDTENLRTFALWAITLLFVMSSLLLAIVAFIYFILPQTKNVEGKCIFHLTLSQSFFYLLAAFHLVPRTDSTYEFTKLIKREYCIVHWYVCMFALMSVFTWSTLLAYHLWSGFRPNLRVNESKVMYLYLLVGYGIPTLSVALGNVHVHWNKLPESDDIFLYYDRCSNHRDYALFYLVLPIIVILCIWLFFIISLYRKLRNEQPVNSPQHANTNLRKYKHRLMRNVKLFLLEGLPFIIMVSSVLITSMFYYALDVEFIIYCVVGLISTEGGIIFYMLVIGRKGILRSLAEKFGFAMAPGWELCSEEGSIENGNENES